MADGHRPRPWSIHEAEAAGYEERPQLHRQESSSDSYVEALDLADYTHELNTRSLTPLHDNYNESIPVSSHYVSPYSISQPPFVNSSSTPTTARSSMSSTSHVLSLPPRLAPSFSSRTQLQLPQRTSRLSPTEDLSRPRAKHVDVLNTYPAFSRGWYAPSVVDVSTHEEAPALPWNSPLGPLHSNQVAPVSDDVKEERMKMLEEEFGDKPLSAASGFEARSYSRGVDDHGNLIIYGKRKRIAARWLQGLLSFGAALSSLYAAFSIHPTRTPPPAAKAPAYILYLISPSTFLIVIWVFLIQAYCCTGRGKDKPPLNPFTQSGMMVLPSSSPRGKKGRKKGKGPLEPVHVNIIVDPTMFNNDKDPGDDDVDGSPKRPKPQSMFEKIALESRRARARRRLKRIMALDVAMALAWCAVFVLILFGGRCPIGGFEGWCNGYNTATACACFLTLCWSASVVFDYRDIMVTRDRRTQPRAHP